MTSVLIVPLIAIIVRSIKVAEVPARGRTTVAETETVAMSAIRIQKSVRMAKHAESRVKEIKTARVLEAAVVRTVTN